MLIFHDCALNYTGMNVGGIDPSREVQWCKMCSFLCPQKQLYQWKMFILKGLQPGDLSANIS